MAKLSLAELKTLVASVVTASNVSNSTFSVTRNNIVGLVDKIGKIVTLDTVFTNDKLAKFDGEYLSFGKTIEDWQQDLIEPRPYTDISTYSLTPYQPFDPTYRPPFYSYSCGKYFIPTTLPNNNIERAVHFEAQLAEIVAMQVKRLSDSMAVYRYGLKKGMLARLADLAHTAMSQSTTTIAASTAYTVGTYIRSASSGTIAYGIVVKNFTSAASSMWTAAVSAGNIIVLDLESKLFVPTDTGSADAFIKQVKIDAEIASDISEGHSLNGNTLGATEGLTLIVKQGVMPVVEVDNEAGAFHLDKVAIPADIIVVNEIPATDTGVYAVLMDSRGMRLHNTYDATRENLNGLADYLNLFRHTEDTAYISRNTFVKVYTATGAV